MVQTVKLLVKKCKYCKAEFLPVSPKNITCINCSSQNTTKLKKKYWKNIDG